MSHIPKAIKENPEALKLLAKSHVKELQIHIKSFCKVMDKFAYEPNYTNSDIVDGAFYKIQLLMLKIEDTIAELQNSK